MNMQINEFLSNLTAFFAFFAVSAVLTIAFTLIYWRITKHDEFKLIKEKSTAAAIAFSGSLIGFALPLVSVMVNSNKIIEMILWGGVAMIVQIGVYFFVRWPMPRISERIEENEIAAGIWLGAASLAGGMLNAASMTP